MFPGFSFVWRADPGDGFAGLVAGGGEVDGAAGLGVEADGLIGHGVDQGGVEVGGDEIGDGGGEVAVGAVVALGGDGEDGEADGGVDAENSIDGCGSNSMEMVDGFRG